MKNRTCTIVSIVLLTLVTVSATKAQSSRERLIANIPFEFSAGNQTFEPGRYEVIVVNPSSDQRVVQIASLEHNQSVLLQTRSITAKKSANARLVFHRYGDQYFLSQAWSASDACGMEPPISGAEKLAMKRHLGIRKTDTVALSRRQ